MAPDEFKKEFIVKNDEHIKKTVDGRAEMSKKLGFDLENPKVAIRFPDTFLFNATASDYLKLLRLNKNINVEEMANHLGIDAASYQEAEDELTYFSDFLTTHSHKLGEVLDVGDFSDWLLTAFIETPNQSFIDSYTPGTFAKEVTLLVPSVVKKINKEGNFSEIR